jgi:hypothetical protein
LSAMPVITAIIGAVVGGIVGTFLYSCGGG